MLGFIGPKAEAEAIKEQLVRFLRDELKLELNQDKTLITHGRTDTARFLGYQVTVQHCDAKLTRGRRSVNGRVALRVPLDVITAKCAPYRCRGKPWHRPRLLNRRPRPIAPLLPPRRGHRPPRLPHLRPAATPTRG